MNAFAKQREKFIATGWRLTKQGVSSQALVGLLECIVSIFCSYTGQAFDGISWRGVEGDDNGVDGFVEQIRRNPLHCVGVCLVMPSISLGS